MRYLSAILSMFRRPAKVAEAYDAEVLFAGWVNPPPVIGEGGDQRAPAAESKRAISA
jgi:hypothetical protein